MRITAAVKWYEMQMVSQAKAAEIAGLSRHDFLMALSRFNVSTFQTTPEELAEEIERDWKLGFQLIPIILLGEKSVCSLV